jgi:hypothetical protein
MKLIIMQTTENANSTYRANSVTNANTTDNAKPSLMRTELIRQLYLFRVTTDMDDKSGLVS